MLVKALQADGRTTEGDPILVIDSVGAGIGETVIITSDGIGARVGWQRKLAGPLVCVGDLRRMTAPSFDIDQIVREVLAELADAERGEGREERGEGSGFGVQGSGMDREIGRPVAALSPDRTAKPWCGHETVPQHRDQIEPSHALPPPCLPVSRSRLPNPQSLIPESLVAAPQSAIPSSSTDLVIRSRVVTMAELTRLDGVRRIVVPRGAVVTPAVQDEPRRRGITVAESSDAAGEPAVAVRIVVGPLLANFDPAALLAAMIYAKGFTPSALRSLA